MNMKNREERAKYNFLDDTCNENLLSEINKLQVKITIIAKLKIWLTDPDIPKAIKENKIKLLRVDFFDILRLCSYC